MSEHAAKTFQDLIVWQKGHELVLSIDHHSESFPKTETYGLTVPNIAQSPLVKVRYYLVLTPDS